MATLKTQTTALVNALHKAKQAEAKPLQVLLDLGPMITDAAELKEVGNAIQAGLIAKGWTEGSANAQRSKSKRILGTMSATDKKMVEAHDIANREQGTQLVHQLATEATNISDLYNALAPTKPEEPTESDAEGADTSDEPTADDAATLAEMFDAFEQACHQNGYTIDDIVEAAMERYSIGMLEAA